MPFKLPKNVSWSIIRGDRKDMTVKVGTDLTGKTVMFTAKVEISSLDATDSTAVIKKNVTDHTDAANGETVIEFMHDDTKNIEPGMYYADIQIVNAGQPISTSVFRIEVLPDVTQRVAA